MKELRRLLLITAATAGLALSLTGCSKNVDFLQYADVTFDGDKWSSNSNCQC